MHFTPWLLAARRAALLVALSAAARVLSAQVTPVPVTPAPASPTPDTTRGRATVPVRADSTRARGPRPARAGVAPRPGLRPPISPRRAFLSSLLVPGLGQSRLERPTAGAVFAAVEIGSIVMLAKSLGDLRAAKSFRADSVPAAYPVDSLGQPLPVTTQTVAPLTNDLVRTRRLHLEDWIATLLFNHLISGAEAYVSANLYDLPAQISARPNARGGGTVALSLAW